MRALSGWPAFFVFVGSVVAVYAAFFLWSLPLSSWLFGLVWGWCRVCLVLGWGLSLVGWVRGAAFVLGFLPPSVPVLCRLRSLPSSAGLSFRLSVWRWLALRGFIPSLG